jgi:predicted TIM-barrel fold metal-dependent hydrolase
MARTTPTDEWPIYNCHIHTFTRKHTPRHFIKFVLSDPKLGRINLLKFLLYLILFALYVTVVFILGNYLAWLSARLDGLNLPVYAVLLLLEGLFAAPLVVLVFMVAALVLLLLAQAALDAAIERRERRQPGRAHGRLMDMRSWVHKGQKAVAHPNILVDLLVWFNPASSNDIFERIARFLRIAAQPTQEDVFIEIQKQYQTKETKTRFVVLPMNMAHMKMGDPKESIDCQHEQLLALAHQYEDQIIPFYAADPRQPGVVEQVRKHVLNGPFRGIKIYPNLGYAPYHATLMEIYAICVEGEIPVLTHCSPGGIWQYGLPEKTRRAYSQPESYQRIFEKYPTLKLCLAHFGGAEEWARRLNRDVRTDRYPEQPWVRTIYEMIANGESQCPNLYTDIAYTAFTPRVKGLYVDLVDYLKVLLSHPRVRTRVLFGSDYYMVEQEKVSEKEASILLRSRLGEDLYKQIAHTNPIEFLRRRPPAAAARQAVKRTKAVRTRPVGRASST